MTAINLSQIAVNTLIPATSLPIDDYHRHPAVSSSQLKKIYRGSVWHSEIVTHKTPAMVVGSIAHAAFEGANLERDFVVVPEPGQVGALKSESDMRAALKPFQVVLRKAGTPVSKMRVAELRRACSEHLPDVPLWDDWLHEFALMNAGRLFVSQKQLDYGEALGRVARQKISRKLGWILEDGAPEVSLFGTVPGYEIPCRCRPDLLSIGACGEVWIVSFKTCPEGKAADGVYQWFYQSRDYDLADAFYGDMFNESTEYSFAGVLNVVVEKHGESSLDATAVAPECVALHEIPADSEAIARGRRKYRAALDKLKQSHRDGCRGYSDTPYTMD